jgi:hypothetical protein
VHTAGPAAEPTSAAAPLPGSAPTAEPALLAEVAPAAAPALVAECQTAAGCPVPLGGLDAPRSRWTLAGIQQVCAWLSEYSPSGVWRVLDRLDIHWNRGRQHVHSPDPDYAAKLAQVAAAQTAVAQDPTRLALVYQDELTYYRQPTVAQAYAAAGSPGPRAERSQRANTATRVAATLDSRTGQVVAVQASRVGITQLVRLYETLVAQAPGVERIYLVQDNWPVHFHPDVLAALEPQTSPFPWIYPRSWPTEPRPRARRLDLPIQLLPLPTYASWTNPIEKLWRWLKQDVLHHHPWANDLPELRRQVLAFLAAFAGGSPALLRYVGLAPTPSGIPP